MLKTRPSFHDANKGIGFILLNPLPAIKRKSESDDSSDCRSSLESPTRHSYVAGTRPTRTLPRRALSTGGVDIKSAALCMDIRSARVLQSSLCKPTNTPPRSKSATSFRAFDRNDPVILIPNIGSRRIYTPNAPSLLPFYGAKLSRTSSSRSITGKLNNMRISLNGVLRPRRSMDFRKMVRPSPQASRQASANITSAGCMQTSRYSSDENMHICSSTDDDSEADNQATPSAPSSATFFRTIRLQQMLKASENSPSSTGSVSPVAQQMRPLNLLQPSNRYVAPPLVIIDKGEVVTGYHPAKRVKRSRYGLAPPAYH